MKILHLTADWKWTGPADPMLNAVLGLRERGHQVELAFPDPPPGQEGGLAPQARSRGIAPVQVLDRGRGYLPVRDRAQGRRLRELLRTGEYDIVHAHHTRDQLLALVASRGLDCRRVFSWHAGEPLADRPWNRLRFGPRALAGLTVLSPGLAARARQSFGWGPERVGVIPGCVDVEHYQRRTPSAALASELGLGAGERVIGVVARLQPHRRFDLLLESFARARSSAKGLRLLVVGRGTRAAQVLDEPVRRLGLGDAVIRAGYRAEDYRDVLSLFDALVFLVPGSDGSCRAVLEAMSMRIPVISSRRGILPETVHDGDTGMLVDEDRASLASAMGDVWHAPARWQAMGEAARQQVIAHHTVQRQAERLEKFYATLAD